MARTDGATTLRTESPSVVEWISGEQPEDHAGQFACCQHQRAFMLVVNGSFELSGVKRVKFRVAHTNPVSRFDQVIPQIGITRPRQNGPIDGPATSAPHISPGRRPKGTGQWARFRPQCPPIDRTNPVYRGQSLRDSRQISGKRLIDLPNLTFQHPNGVQMHHQAELARLGFLRSEAKGLLRQPLQTMGNILRRFQRRPANRHDFLRGAKTSNSGQW